MLLLLAVPMFALAIWLVAKGTQEAMKRLGLDLMSVLVWMGLADWESPAEATRDRVIARFDERARRGALAPHGRSRAQAL